MNELILRALMQLFAIITDIRKEVISGEARDLVRIYLERHLNRSLAKKYLALFDKYLERYHYDSLLSGDSSKIQKETALNSVKILRICNQIREELELEPRMLVLLELLEFIKKENIITEQELEFVNIIAESLKIDTDDYENIKAFIYRSVSDIPDKSRILIIDKNKDFNHPQIKHHTNEKLRGQIIVLHIKSTNTLIFHYYGKEDLFLNGHYIKPGSTHVLSVGSLIKSSRIKPIYYSNVISKFILAESNTMIDFRAIDIVFHFPNSESGVHRFNMKDKSGQLVGIIGGSGTGKSTLLNVLNGNLKLHEGQITINGYDLHEDKESLEGVIGFVPQDDLLIEELTVFQNLYYNAKLCFNNFDEQQIIKTVENALKDFDLVEARDLKVGNPLNKFISGGQRKRLNIALELIREPSILFIDEPTSGLSSLDSEKVMYLLKRQTIKGKLVVVNIHQPSSDLYKLFDKILILDKGGRVVYNGNPMDAITHFKHKANFVNPTESECKTCGNVQTDQPLRIIESRMVDSYGRLIRKRKVSPEEWYENYIHNYDVKINDSEISEKKPLPVNYFKIPGRLKQFKIFTIRDFLSKLNNKQYLLISLLEAPVLAFILGYLTKFVKGVPGNPSEYIFYENKNLPAYLFMSVIVALFIGLVTSAEEIIKDRRILKRESFLNLSRFSYLGSKIVLMFSLSAIQAFTYVVVGNSILGVKGMYFDYWLVLFSASCLMNVAGLIISSAFNSVVTIYILIPFILVPQLLLSGVVVNFNDLHPSISTKKYVPVIGDLMASRWAYEALAVNQFKNNEYEKLFFEYSQKISEANYYVAYFVPHLENKLEQAVYNKNKIGKEALIENNIKYVFRNINKFIENNNEVFPDNYQMKSPAASTLSVDKYKDILERINIHYIEIQNVYTTKRDSQINSIVSKQGKDWLYLLKKDYHNEYIENYVLNKLDLEKIVDYKGELVRRKEPGYQMPVHKAGRAHFYAPYKKIGSKFIDTLYFNLIIIWCWSVLLFICLQIDLLGKLVRFVEKIRLRNPQSALHKRV